MTVRISYSYVDLNGYSFLFYYRSYYEQYPLLTWFSIYKREKTPTHGISYTRYYMQLIIKTVSLFYAMSCERLLFGFSHLNTLVTIF